MKIWMLKKKLPLDIYKNNLVLGFSYYKLLSSYKGYCVKVRRSSDNAEMDFGFVNNYIDYTSILAFCGAGSGYVSIWYNQYASGNNAVQATSGNQPRIVDGGTFEEAGLNFIGSSFKMTVNNYTAIDITTPKLSIYIKCKISSDGWIFGKNLNASANMQYGLYCPATNAIYCYFSGLDRIYSDSNTASDLATMFVWNNKNSNGITSYSSTFASRNGTFGNDISYSGSSLYIGCRGAGATYFTGNVKSLILLNSSINDFSIISKV